MNKKHPLYINESARRMIFAGLPVGVLALAVLVDSHEHFIGDKLWPYLFFGLVMIMAVLGLTIYNIMPKRFRLPLGVIGWAILFLILFCNIK